MKSSAVYFPPWFPVKIALSADASGWRWQRAQSELGWAFARGFAFQGDRLYADRELAEWALRHLGEPGNGSRAPFWAGLNGCFAIVVVTPERLALGVDRVRSMPLFYRPVGGRLWVGDRADQSVEEGTAPVLRTLAAREFRLTGYVTGNETLVENLFQVQAGEWITLTPTSGGVAVAAETYFRYTHAYRARFDRREALAALDEALLSAHRRLVALAQGRRLVVPLSGGLDSRIIVIMLRRLGYDNVLTYTYGPPGNSEARIALQVAAALGYPWTLAPYSRESWQACSQSSEWADYIPWAHNWSSWPVVTGWPAVRWLQREGMVPADSLFVPGHSGGLLAGSGSRALTGLYTGQTGRGEVWRSIWKHDYGWILDRTADEYASVDTFGERIRQRLGGLAVYPDAASAYEAWNIAERQAKFIVNSMRIFDFFGYTWALPLWDAARIDFWRWVPREFRLSKVLYTEYMDDQFKRWARLGEADLQAFQRESSTANRNPRVGWRRAFLDQMKPTWPGRWLTRRRTRQHLRDHYADDHLGMCGVEELERILNMDPQPRNGHGVIMHRHFLDRGGRGPRLLGAPPDRLEPSAAHGSRETND